MTLAQCYNEKYQQVLLFSAVIRSLRFHTLTMPAS